MLLVFVTAFRVTFYWGQKSVRPVPVPTIGVQPSDETPPIWWR